MSFLAKCCRGCLTSRHQLLSLSSSGKIIQSKRNIAAEALLSWYSALPQVLVTENVVLTVHSMGTGHWALDIIAMTCLGRVVLSGVATTYMRKILASHAITCKDVTQEKRRLRLDLRKRVSSGEMPPLLARELKMQAFAQLNKKHQDLILMHNNHPGKAYMALVIEGICWVTYGLSLRNITAGFPPDIASEAAVEMKSQSFLWITDLSLPDPYYVIPLLSTSIFLFSTSFMKEWRRQNLIPDFHLLQRFLPLPIASIIFYMSTQLPCVSRFSSMFFNLHVNEMFSLFAVNNVVWVDQCYHGFCSGRVVHSSCCPSIFKDTSNVRTSSTTCQLENLQD